VDPELVPCVFNVISSPVFTIVGIERQPHKLYVDEPFMIDNMLNIISPPVKAPVFSAVAYTAKLNADALVQNSHDRNGKTSVSRPIFRWQIPKELLHTPRQIWAKSKALIESRIQAQISASCGGIDAWGENIYQDVKTHHRIYNLERQVVLYIPHIDVASQVLKNTEKLYAQPKNSVFMLPKGYTKVVESELQPYWDKAFQVHRLFAEGRSGLGATAYVRKAQGLLPNKATGLSSVTLDEGVLPFSCSVCTYRFPAKVNGADADIVLDKEAISLENDSVMLDSGVGGSCFVGKDFCATHGIKTFPLQGNVRLRFANEGTSDCNQYANIKVHLGGARFHLQALVVDGLVDILLGDVWMKRYKAVLDYGNNTLSFAKGTKKYTSVLPSVKSLAELSEQSQSEALPRDAFVSMISAKGVGKLLKTREVVDACLYIVSALDPPLSLPSAV